MNQARKTITVTRLRMERKLPGTDLLCQYRSIVNMPGVTQLWVGRIRQPAVAGVQPTYETMEEAWIFEGEEFYSVDDLMHAWNGGIERRVLRDRLAEALRRLVHGLIRPLWTDMREEDREPWRIKAAALMKLFASFDLEFSLMENQDG
jgi:hypothetical protein